MSQPQEYVTNKLIKKKRRRLLRWIARVFVALLGLAVVLLVIADLARQSRMRTNTERLKTALAQVDDKILKGMTPAQWHASRIQGSNGWKHIAVIRDAWREARDWGKDSWEYDPPRPEPELVRLGRVFANLSSYHDGEWQGELPDDAPPDADPPTTPTDDQLKEWLATTDSVAEGFAKAALCDTVVVLPGKGEPYPYWTGLPVIPVLNAHRAMVGRCMALIRFGRTDQAWRELLNYIAVCSKYTQPSSEIAFLTQVGAWRLGIEYASECVEVDLLPLEIARTIAAVRFEFLDRLVRAIEADTVWFAASAEAADWAFMEPRWFGWIRGGIPPGKGTFGEMGVFNSLRSAYFGPANMTEQIAIALEGGVLNAEFVRGADSWDATRTPVVEDSLFALNPSHLFALRANLVEKSLQWLKFDLRILEREGGPLRQVEAQVAALVSRYPGVRISWDEDNLLLGILPQWMSDIDVAASRDPISTVTLPDMRHLFNSQSDDEDDTWPVRLSPIAKPGGE